MDGIHIVRRGDLPPISKGKWCPRLPLYSREIHYPNPKLPPILQRKTVSNYSLFNFVKSVCKTSMFFSSPYHREGSSIQERILWLFPPNLKKLVLGRYSSRRILGTGDCTRFAPILSFVHAMINNDLLSLFLSSNSILPFNVFISISSFIHKYKPGLAGYHWD
jgi:hypothetical protein